jgi:hypothetical protein
MSNDITLPSRHNIGDLVTITARVAGIQFVGDKVRYAFDIGPDLSIVDSEHVLPILPEYCNARPEIRAQALDMALRTTHLEGHGDVLKAAREYVKYIVNGGGK